jgi:hypothetical protein
MVGYPRKEKYQMFQIDQSTANSLANFGKRREQVKKEKRAEGTRNVRRPRKGRKRRRHEDTPLTKRFVYRVKDETSKTIHICVGVGQTEELVDALEAEGHTLYLFSATKSGARLNPPQPYQCIMDSAGNKGNFTYSWMPTEDWTSCIIHDDEEGHGLLIVTPWPYHPNGLHFRLTATDPEERKNLEPGVVSMSQDTQDEMIYLKKAQDRGKTIVRETVSPEQWLRAACGWMEAVPTKEALGEFRTYLERNVVSWPPTPAQAAEINKGGSLVLKEDMCPNDSWITKEVTHAPVGDYDPHTKVEMHPEYAKPAPKPACKLVVWRGDERRVVTAGGLNQCQRFAASPTMENLKAGGFTHYQILDIDGKPATEVKPLPEYDPGLLVKADYVGGDVIEVPTLSGERVRYRINRSYPSTGENA